MPIPRISGRMADNVYRKTAVTKFRHSRFNFYGRYMYEKKDCINISGACVGLSRCFRLLRLRIRRRVSRSSIQRSLIIIRISKRRSGRLEELAAVYAYEAEMITLPGPILPAMSCCDSGFRTVAVFVSLYEGRRGRGHRLRPPR
jgi:hypothetical protein